MNELDKVVLAAFRPEEEVGIYNAAFRIARQILIVMPALNAAISPYVAPLLAEGRIDELRRMYVGTVRWSFAAGWSAALLFGAFASDFLGLFGDDFRAGTHVLIVVCLGHLVQAAAGTVPVIIQYSGHEKKELVNGVLVMAVSVALNFALVPPFGALGAAYASLVSLALVNGLRMVQAWRILDVMPFDRSTVHVALVAVGGLAIGAALRALTHAIAGDLGAAGGAAAATVGMGLAWLIYFARVKVSADEATLLRLPKRWARAAAAPPLPAPDSAAPTSASSLLRRIKKLPRASSTS
jgi:O-antigen/teichoic acid export membrane protein